MLNQLGFGRKELGMISVEWALTLPAMLVVILALLNGIMQISTVAVVDNAAKETARYMSLGHSEKATKNFAKTILGTDIEIDIVQNHDLAEVRIKKDGIGLFGFAGFDFVSSYQVVKEPVGW